MLPKAMAIMRQLMDLRTPLSLTESDCELIGRIIEAARCTLPLSSTTRIGDLALGTRHRAGLGITEQTDAVAVIISEETGAISIADNGELQYKISIKDLRKELRERLVLTVQRTVQNVKEAIRPQ